jgi:hypothetical protein
MKPGTRLVYRGFYFFSIGTVLEGGGLERIVIEWDARMDRHGYLIPPTLDHASFTDAFFWDRTAILCSEM